MLLKSIESSSGFSISATQTLSQKSLTPSLEHSDAVTRNCDAVSTHYDKGTEKLNDDKGKGKGIMKDDKGYGKGKGIVKDHKENGKGIVKGIKELDALEKRTDNVEAGLIKLRDIRLKQK
ncbi:hypothetical protein Tco_0880352, partial [Tanacetum coccineum]